MFVTRLFGLGLIAATLVACGSTSDLASLDAGVNGPPAGVTSFSRYDRVVVREFVNKTEDQSEAANTGVEKFGMYIASNLRGNAAFKEVVQEGKNQHAEITPSTLVVDGDVTRYVEGNKALRLLVGMGAGSSYFDATVNVRDGESGRILAQSKADHNSWGLGGGVAMSQTVDSFMNLSAATVATQVADAKKATVQPAAGLVEAQK